MAQVLRNLCTPLHLAMLSRLEMTLVDNQTQLPPVPSPKHPIRTPSSLPLVSSPASLPTPVRSSLSEQLGRNGFMCALPSCIYFTVSDEYQCNLSALKLSQYHFKTHETRVKRESAFETTIYFGDASILECNKMKSK
jgi:hypothetical protein